MSRLQYSAAGLPLKHKEARDHYGRALAAAKALTGRASAIWMPRVEREKAKL